MITTGSRVISPNKEGKPSGLKITPKVTPKSENAAPKEFSEKLIIDKSVIPKIKLKTVVITIPSKIAPRTCFNIIMIVMNKPARPIRTAGFVKSTSSGKIPPVETTLVTPPGKASAIGSPPLTATILLASEVNFKRPKFLTPK